MDLSETKTRMENTAKITEFLKSPTEKIHLVIGAEEAGLYRFLEDTISAAADNENQLVFRYEFWASEHHTHYLYRWLRETAFGQAFRGNGSWVELAKAQPQLIDRLYKLVSHDIRSLDIRFIEAIRFITQTLKAGQQVVLCFAPRADLEDKILVDFFNALLRILPVGSKMIIGQIDGDFPARQSDFCPSNRLMLDAIGDGEGADIGRRYESICRSGENPGVLLSLMAELKHPADVDLLAHLTGEPEGTVAEILNSPDITDLVEKDAHGHLRLVYPRSFLSRSGPGPEPSRSSGEGIGQKALAVFEKRLEASGEIYPDALYHSMNLMRFEDTGAISQSTLAGLQPKLKIGMGDICELELGHVLKLLGDTSPDTRARVLLRLGEVCELRQRNREAMEALDPAIDILAREAHRKELQYAYELKGRSAFAVRETETAEAAFMASLDVARKMDREDLAADITSQLGYLHYSSKQLDKAETFYTNALNGYRRISKTDKKAGHRGEAAQLSNLGHTDYARGQFDKAEAYHREALRIYESLGATSAAANEWGYIGHTFFATKSFQKAVQAYEKAAALESEQGQLEKAAQRYANVGHSMYAQRDSELAISSFEKSLGIYRDLGNPAGEAAQLSNLGLVNGDQGEFEKAVDYFSKAGQMYSEMGDVINEATQITRKGHVRRAQKKYDLAGKHYREALELYMAVGYKMGQADTELELGHLYVETGNWVEASKACQNAKSIYAEIGHQEKEALCWMMQGQVEKGAGDISKAISAVERAVEIFKGMENTMGLANATSQLGFLNGEQKRFDAAETCYREALELFRKGKDREGEANILSNLGTLYYDNQQIDKSLKAYEKALLLLRRMNHPLGIAGVLANVSFIHEQRQKLDLAYECAKEAAEVYAQLRMAQEAEAMGRRLKDLEERAGESLKNLRAELVPGLATSGETEKGSKAKIGRNEPCPCGSGKKYKKCCGT
jgi:tetratricopeptide (TPR) repeat protein